MNDVSGECKCSGNDVNYDIYWDDLALTCHVSISFCEVYLVSPQESGKIVVTTLCTCLFDWLCTCASLLA